MNLVMGEEIDQAWKWKIQPQIEDTCLEWREDDFFTELWSLLCFLLQYVHLGLVYWSSWLKYTTTPSQSRWIESASSFTSNQITEKPVKWLLILLDQLLSICKCQFVGPTLINLCMSVCWANHYHMVSFCLGQFSSHFICINLHNFVWANHCLLAWMSFWWANPVWSVFLLLLGCHVWSFILLGQPPDQNLWLFSGDLIWCPDYPGHFLSSIQMFASWDISSIYRTHILCYYLIQCCPAFLTLWATKEIILEAEGCTGQ